MANLKGEHTFRVGNGAKARTYKMRLDANAFAEIEEVLGMTLPELMAALRKPSIRIFRAVLYGALFHHHQMSIQDAGDLLGEIGFERTVEEVGKLTAMVLPKEKPKPAGEGEPPGRAAKAPAAKRKASPGPGKARS